MEQKTITFQDYKAIFLRRKWALIFPTIFIIIIGVIFASSLPPVYKATSTILIEDQEINADYVMSSVTGYAEKQIQNIKQRIISSTRLIDIINQVGLYDELKGKTSINKLVDKMKENISLEPISVEMVDRRSGRLITATIAFIISFEGKGDPVKVFKTTEVLTSLFLEENLKDRKRQVIKTSTFLEEEQNRIKNHLADIDHSIASFKARNINLLPEVFQANIQALIDIERKIEQLEEQKRSFNERGGYLEAQIAGIPSNEYSNNYKRINELKTQLGHLRTSYSDYYPDIINLKTEINQLQKNINRQNNKQRVLSDNPSYVILTSQLNSVRNNLASLKKQIADLKKQKEIYSKRIKATPRIEEAYTPLVMKRKNTQVKYDDLTMKVMEAKVAQGLEKEQKGGGFTLIEPARMPENPFKPNRKAIVLISFVLGLGAGIGLASILEFSDNAIHTIDDIAIISRFPVLGEIPEIRIPNIKRIKKKELLLLEGTITTALNKGDI